MEKAYNPAEVDKKWIVAWREHEVFKANADSSGPPFTIILPPPNITGSLTVGHALGTTVQDLLCRWKRMRGFNVLWLAGMDHAGIATQKVVERSLLEGGITKDDLGREKFLEECWRWKEKYHDRIVEQLDRLGASLDWSRETFTLDPGVSRAVREVFVRLHRKGLIYRDRYIVNWCPSCGTAISDEEVDFVETHGKLYYVAYPFAEGVGEIVVGTTRPETILGDVAVAVNPGDGRTKALEGKMLALPLVDRQIPIIFDDAVDPAFGTGCLKVTPAHDATDFAIGLKHSLAPVIVIDREGKMNENAGRFAGLDRREARKQILSALEEQGLLRKIEDYDHSIGHHDRCGTAIEPYISRQWFMCMKSLAEPAIEVVEQGGVTFTPERWRNIYLSWMENIRDWCISRQLWWGHRIPVWYCGDCEETVLAVDEPKSCPRCGGAKLRQDDDVLDTWFSSWLWSFSPMGWPEETKDLERFHPTSVLVTGGDIIFFWVARMIMAAIEFRGEIPFSSVYLTGIVRDTKGRKMSKSLGNSPDPIDIIDRSGADAMRFTLMMLSPPGQDIVFEESKVDVGRHFANKIWNAARLVLGQEFDVEKGGVETAGSAAELHRSVFGSAPGGEIEFGWEDYWIISRLGRRSRDLEGFIDTYRFDEASRALYDFLWHEYCDWYLELSKSASRGGGARSRGTTIVARAVLGASMMLLHPIMPFITEEIWSMLAPSGEMLAHSRFPGIPDRYLDDKLEADVEFFKEIVTAIRNLRQSFNIPPGRLVNVVINCENGRGLPERLERFVGQIELLAKVDGLKVAEGAAKPSGSVGAGLANVEIYMMLRGIIDVDAEKRRLGKELEKLGRECEKVDGRLRDRRFIEKAPPDVVEQERNRYNEMSDKKRRIVRILEDLG
ncbi:MAG: valine--tRNA ligase [Candidatus Krumholzibacteria bacterium]|nr:valine--tRNA ligase [Candidatus Krumholzibacteria bacterium]